MTKEEYFITVWQRLAGGNGCFSVIACFLAAILLLLSSCATKTKIEFRDRTVDHYNTVTVHDTTKVEIRDSTYHLIKVVGDTVYDTKYIEKTRWRDRVVEKHDTCWSDSVDIQYKETVKEVVKYPKTYWYAVGISILFFIFAFVKIFVKLKH